MFSLTGYLDNIYNDVNSGYVAVLVCATNTISNEEPGVSRFCLVSSFILTTAKKKKKNQLVTCSFFTKKYSWNDVSSMSNLARIYFWRPVPFNGYIL